MCVVCVCVCVCVFVLVCDHVCLGLCFKVRYGKEYNKYNLMREIAQAIHARSSWPVSVDGLAILAFVYSCGNSEKGPSACIFQDFKFSYSGSLKCLLHIAS